VVIAEQRDSRDSKLVNREVAEPEPPHNAAVTVDFKRVAHVLVKRVVDFVEVVGVGQQPVI
jgi:Holliday junction resolvasome RuvABC ATP-dependent DNA helicase subunit